MRALLLSLPLGALLLSGCRSERYLQFVTEPPGAQVRIDGKPVGRTPLDLRFDSYGTRRISISRPGFRRHNEVMEVEPPWFSYFPLDYISEVLLPFGWEDIHRLEVVLDPHAGAVTQPDFEAVLERAEGLRRGGPSGPQASPEKQDPTDEGEEESPGS